MSRILPLVSTTALLFCISCSSTDYDFCLVYYPDGRIENGSANVAEMKTGTNEEFEITRIRLKRDGAIQELEGEKLDDARFEAILEQESTREKVVVLFANKNNEERRIKEIVSMANDHEIRLIQIGLTKERN